VGSARELARLCDSEDAYRWLCSGVGVDHHTLSDCRVEQAAAPKPAPRQEPASAADDTGKDAPAKDTPPKAARVSTTDADVRS
jgi:hypothetical protein